MSISVQAPTMALLYKQNNKTSNKRQQSLYPGTHPLSKRTNQHVSQYVVNTACHHSSRIYIHTYTKSRDQRYTCPGEGIIQQYTGRFGKVSKSNTYLYKLYQETGNIQMLYIPLYVLVLTNKHI